MVAFAQCGLEAGSVDIRALRADALDRWRRRLCREPYEGPGDPDVLATLHVGCVEGACELVEPMEPAWCLPSIDTVRVVSGGALVRRPRDLSCLGGTTFCDAGAECFSVADPGPPTPAAAMTRCARDADCTIASPDCCDCGADDHRAIRADAVARWRRCPRVVTCLACVSPAPALLGACVGGTCRALEPREQAVCDALE
jgi:hypothetical protein